MVDLCRVTDEGEAFSNVWLLCPGGRLPASWSGVGALLYTYPLCLKWGSLESHRSAMKSFHLSWFGSGVLSSSFAWTTVINLAWAVGRGNM